MHGIFDALVAAAAADVTGHGFADLVVGRLRIFVQKGRRLHDLAGLAIAALRDVDLTPSLLNRMIAGRVHSFDGGDLAADDVGDRRYAGAHRLLVDHDSAGTAERLAAAEFGADQSGLVTKIPKQRKIRVAVPILFLAINLHFDHDGFLALFKL